MDTKLYRIVGVSPAGDGVGLEIRAVGVDDSVQIDAGALRDAYQANRRTKVVLQ